MLKQLAAGCWLILLTGLPAVAYAQAAPDPPATQTSETQAADDSAAKPDETSGQTPASPEPAGEKQEKQAPGTVRSQFDSLDQNGDGEVSSSEWGYTREEFQALDEDRDGKLTSAEYRGGRDERDYDGRFTGQDQNKDGKLTRSEWYYGEEAFKAADKNGDGALSTDEFFGDTDPRDKDGRFGSLDQNHDKKITSSEWTFGSESFGQADTNGDGVISDEEFFSQVPAPTTEPLVAPRRRR
jgi:Ca2+-binding EF-hand superfamily protein